MLKIVLAQWMNTAFIIYFINNINEAPNEEYISQVSLRHPLSRSFQTGSDGRAHSVVLRFVVVEDYQRLVEYATCFPIRRILPACASYRWCRINQKRPRTSK